MITKNITGIMKDPVFIGRKGENLATKIIFDVPDDLADYAYTVYVQRPREQESYPAAYIAKENGSIVWTVSNVDTAYSGTGEVQIRFTDDDVVVKTMIYAIQIGRAIDINTSDPPEWEDTWLDALTALAEATHTSEENAKESEDNAKASELAAATSEANAKDSEDNAAESEANALASAQSAGDSATSAQYWAGMAEQSAEEAGYITFEIDENGHLIYTKTPYVELDFSISNGHLYVEV